eukprot:5820307-Pyramimonas_sp.AAC.1
MMCPKVAHVDTAKMTSNIASSIAPRLPRPEKSSLAGSFFAPNFVGNPPPGTGLEAAKFWCRDPYWRPEEAFLGDVYIDGSGTCHGHCNFNAAGFAVVCMERSLPPLMAAL